MGAWIETQLKNRIAFGKPIAEFGLIQRKISTSATRLYAAESKPAPIVEAACWAHARRKFFDLARINKAPIAAEAVSRIDALFAIERQINGAAAPQRVVVRTERSRPLVIDLESWLREQRTRVSKNSDTGKAIDYSLKRWIELTRFLDDGRLCMTNNAAERELRAVAVGRRNWTFDGQAQRRRSAGLARRRARKGAGLSRQTGRRSPAMELACRTPCCRLSQRSGIKRGRP